MRRILVVNPNTSERVTADIASSVSGISRPDGFEVECVTLPGGPDAVQTQADVEKAAHAIGKFMQREQASAVVVACYSDPGVQLLRATLSIPVFGIGETSMLVSTMMAERFGIIAILPASADRQQRYVRTLGLDSRYAGSRDIGVGVRSLVSDSDTLPRMIQVGRWLRDERQAGVIILGCAGMATYCAQLEDALDMPVLEPSRITVSVALGLMAMGKGSVEKI